MNTPTVKFLAWLSDVLLRTSRRIFAASLRIEQLKFYLIRRRAATFRLNA